jgi:hypothetical protein
VEELSLPAHALFYVCAALHETDSRELRRCFLFALSVVHLLGVVFSRRSLSRKAERCEQEASRDDCNDGFQVSLPFLGSTNSHISCFAASIFL